MVAWSLQLTEKTHWTFAINICSMDEKYFCQERLAKKMHCNLFSTFVPQIYHFSFFHSFSSHIFMAPPPNTSHTFVNLHTQNGLQLSCKLHICHWFVLILVWCWKMLMLWEQSNFSHSNHMLIACFGHEWWMESWPLHKNILWKYFC